MAKIMPEGLGVWIWELRQCEQGDIHKILNRCKDCGIKWIAIKSGDASLNPGFDNVIAVLLDLFHSNGIKVYTWNYSKPSTWQREVVQVKQLVTAGVDGHILDAEIEWQTASNNKVEAVNFLTALRAEIGDTFLAHGPFAVVNYHGAFPYAEFGEYCDAAMPQSYWTEFNWDVQKTISMTDSSWNLFNIHNPNSKKPVWPIGVTYGKGYPGVQGVLNQEDLVKFLEHYKGLPVSLYSYDAASQYFHQTFETLAALNKGLPLPQPGPAVPMPVPAPEPPPAPVPVSEPTPAPPAVVVAPPVTVAPVVNAKSFMDVIMALLKFFFHIPH